MTDTKGNRRHAAFSNTGSILASARAALDGEGANAFSSKLVSEDLKRARDLLSAEEQPTIGTIHHFACTGGTVLSRSIQAQPNIRVLSEVDPLSEKSLVRGRKGFAPTDLIALSRTGLYDISAEVIVQMFLASLDVLFEHMRNTGQKLILRDHAHSRYCTGVDYEERPGLLEIVRQRYQTNSAVSVRHPLQSWLAMKENSFVEFPNEGLDEYCLRYIAFLEDHSQLPIVRYEEFVASPQRVVKELCEYLDISYSDDWPDMMPAIKLTGDSGRSGDEIEPRKGREISDEMRAECENSKHFQTLCERLDYQQPGK